MTALPTGQEAQWRTQTGNETAAARKSAAISKHDDQELCDWCSKYDPLIEFISTDLESLYTAHGYNLKNVTKMSSEILESNNLHGVIYQKDGFFISPAVIT